MRLGLASEPEQDLEQVLAYLASAMLGERVAQLAELLRVPECSALARQAQRQVLQVALLWWLASEQGCLLDSVQGLRLV